MIKLYLIQKELPGLMSGTIPIYYCFNQNRFMAFSEKCSQVTISEENARKILEKNAGAKLVCIQGEMKVME